MTAIQSMPHDQKWQQWKERLDFSFRQPPEFYENVDEVKNTPHAKAIRTAIRELNLQAVFCVQDVPTTAILRVPEYERKSIIRLHADLWNQGLASLLIVLSDNDDTVRAFSLDRIPHKEDHDFNNRCLVRTLNATSEVLAIKDIIYGAESGRLWEKYADYFRPEERIDQVLLNNLTIAHQKLSSNGLPADASQALLIQTMFIAYLEDREIIGQEYFQVASNSQASTFSELLRQEKVASLEHLFRKLREDFNGDLFTAPCSFGEEISDPPLGTFHLKVVADFRSGRVEMSENAGQYRFWGYNFQYIPIELISAVYDRFLGENRRKQGAYYTPMFLADTVVSQTWETLSEPTKNEGEFLDPACGSGMFLVRLFQRLCEHWREARKVQTIDWEILRQILARLHGWDIDGAAVRVAVFSLYIALLEEVDPPDIRLLVKNGKALPLLWGHNLRAQDFFHIPSSDKQFDVIIGNPPWVSRKGSNRSSIVWCNTESLPAPSQEDAWAFVWKSLRHLQPGGTVALLLPAMGFLHNHSKKAIHARNRFIGEARIFRIINFVDLRFQLFKDAKRPTALIIYKYNTQVSPVYRFDYWVPKADLNLRTRRLITLDSTVKSRINSHMAKQDPLIFKKRIWMTEPEAKLFNYMSTFPKLRDIVKEYRMLKRRGEAVDGHWVIGQGFKPANSSRRAESSYESEYSGIIIQIPYLPTEAFSALTQNCSNLTPSNNRWVHRKGFEEGFDGPRVLIPQGVITKQHRLRAAYTENPLTFQDSIQAIVVPKGAEHRAKLLTALLNSKAMLWFAFHGTASFGADRPIVDQAGLLHLPFPSPSDMPDPEQSQSAEKDMVSIIDEAIRSEKDGAFCLQSYKNEIFGKLDRLVTEFFCLSKEEIILIDDTVERVIPASHPGTSKFPEIWRHSEESDRRAYADTLVHAMDGWFTGNVTMGIKLKAKNQDSALLCLSLQETQNNSGYVEESDISLSEALGDIFSRISQPIPGNFQSIPNFRVFIGKDLYLVKPIQKRFWLRSTALADADAIALDLQDAIGLLDKRSRA